MKYVDQNMEIELCIDNATKRQMAVEVLKGKGRRSINIENEVTIGDCLNRILTIAEKTAFSAILWGKIQSFRSRNLFASYESGMADMARVIGAPMATVPTLEEVLGARFTVNEINAVVALIVRKTEDILNRSLTEDEKTEISAIIARR